METYWDLDNRARLALTEDQITLTYIPREVASQGLLMPQPPILEVVPPKPEADEPATSPYYAVKGIVDGKDMQFDALFLTLEAAKAFIALAPQYHTSKYGPNYKSIHMTLVPARYEVELVNVVSGEQHDAYTEIMAEFNRITKANDEANAKYRKQLTAIEDAGKDIWKNWRALARRRAYLEQVIVTLREFIAVADGDVGIAIKFLLKKEPGQGVFDAMNEIEHGLEWSVESFVGVCLAVDNDPYRDADKAAF